MKILLLSLSFIITQATIAQTVTISGKAYRNAQFYQDGRDFITNTFILRQKSKKIDKAYQLESVGEKINKDDLLYGIWIIESGDFFFLNVYRYGFGYPKCFVLFKKRGNYYLFKARPKMTASQEQRLINSQIMFGVVGSGVAANKIAKENANKWYNVFDFSKGTVQALSEFYIKNLLEDYPQLYRDYMNENDRSSIETLKMYLEKVNEME